MRFRSHPMARSIARRDRKSTRLNSSHSQISYAVFCLKKKQQHVATITAHVLTERMADINFCSANGTGEDKKYCAITLPRRTEAVTRAGSAQTDPLVTE